MELKKIALQPIITDTHPPFWTPPAIYNIYRKKKNIEKGKFSFLSSKVCDDSEAYDFIGMRRKKMCCNVLP